MKTIAALILLGLAGIVSPHAAHAAEDLPGTCAQAEILAMGNRFDLAEAFAEKCYSEPGASREVVIFGRYTRANALLRLERPREALEQFEFLMQPAYAASTLYDRRSNGLKYLGATQALIATQAARLSLGLGDNGKALTYVEAALKLCALSPATHIDVAGNAYMLRARIRAARQDMRGGTVDLVRAFIRGSQDPWVLDNIKSLPAADMERVTTLQTRMLAAYRDYLKVYSVSGMVSSETYLSQLKSQGDPLYQSVIADETAYLGADS